MLSKALIIAIVFLCLLAFLVWVLSKVFKPEIIVEKEEKKEPPEKAAALMSEVELLAAKEKLNFKKAALKSKQELAAIQKQLDDVDTALAKFDKPVDSATKPSVN